MLSPGARRVILASAWPRGSRRRDAGEPKRLLQTGTRRRGGQSEQPERWHPEQYATRLSAGVALTIDGRDVWVGAWLYVVAGQTGDPAETASGQDQESLYWKLEDVVLPLYYERRPAWIAVMKGAVAKSAPYFNSHRMMRRYVTEAYLH